MTEEKRLKEIEEKYPLPEGLEWRGPTNYISIYDQSTSVHVLVWNGRNRFNNAYDYLHIRRQSRDEVIVGQPIPAPTLEEAVQIMHNLVLLGEV